LLLLFFAHTLLNLLLIVESFIDILQNRSKNLLAIIFDLLASSESDVSGGDDVETSKYTSTGDTSENVSTSTFHHGHETFVLQNLGSAIDGTLVFNTTTTGHHHSSSDGIDWVGSQTRNNGDRPTEEEGDKSGSRVANNDWFQRIVKSKVQTSVDEDTDARDDETSVETSNTIRSQSLLVNIDQTVVLSFTVLSFGIVSQSGSGKVQRVDNSQGQGTSETTRGDVGGEFLPLWSGFWGGKSGFDGVFEGKVQSLGWEVSEDVGEVTSPEWSDTFGGQSSFAAIHDTSVWFVKSTLFDHFILVLDEEFDSLDWGGDGFGDTGGDTREHKVLEEVEFTTTRHDSNCDNSL